jgi:hypothetical protein
MLYDSISGSLADKRDLDKTTYRLSESGVLILKRSMPGYPFLITADASLTRNGQFKKAYRCPFPFFPSILKGDQLNHGVIASSLGHLRSKLAHAATAHAQTIDQRIGRQLGNYQWAAVRMRLSHTIVQLIYVRIYPPEVSDTSVTGVCAHPKLLRVQQAQLPPRN